MKGEEGKENLLEMCLPQAFFRHITHKIVSLEIGFCRALYAVQSLKSCQLPQECLHFALNVSNHTYCPPPTCLEGGGENRCQPGLGAWVDFAA